MVVGVVGDVGEGLKASVEGKVGQDTSGGCHGNVVKVRNRPQTCNRNTRHATQVLHAMAVTYRVKTTIPFFSNSHTGSKLQYHFSLTVSQG